MKWSGALVSEASESAGSVALVEHLERAKVVGGSYFLYGKQDLKTHGSGPCSQKPFQSRSFADLISFD